MGAIHVENEGSDLQGCIYPLVNGVRCMKRSPLLHEAMLLYALNHAPTLNFKVETAIASPGAMSTTTSSRVAAK